MKIRSSIKKMCGACRIIKRGKHNYVYCEKHPRHKQRQGFATSTLPSTSFAFSKVVAAACSSQMRIPLLQAAPVWNPVESIEAMLRRTL